MLILYFLHRKIDVNGGKSYTILEKEVIIMFKSKYHLYLSEGERNQLILSLIDLRNRLIEAGKYTDLADETLAKLSEAKIKRIKVAYK